MNLRGLKLTITKSGEDITEEIAADTPAISPEGSTFPEERGNISLSGAYSVNAVIRIFEHMNSEDIVKNEFDVLLKPVPDYSQPQSFANQEEGILYLAILQGHPFLVSRDMHLVQIPLGRGEYSSKLLSSSPVERSIASIILDSKRRARQNDKDISFPAQRVTAYYDSISNSPPKPLIMSELKNQRAQGRMWLHVEGYPSRAAALAALKKDPKTRFKKYSALDLMKSTTRIQLHKPFSWHVIDSL